MSAETTAPVGVLLKEYRLAAGLTQETLAERAGISVRSVQAIEGGTNKPQRDTARRLADALGLGPDERVGLLAGVSPTPRRRSSTTPSSVLAFTAPWAVAPTVEMEARPSTAPRLRPSIQKSMPGGALPVIAPRNPYKGLRAFRAEDAGDFFGRAALVAELVAAVRSYTRPDAARFLAVVGPSGSGKSSAVLAGLLPHLCRDAVPGSADWVYLDPLLPGAHPLESLSVIVANVLPHSSLTALRADLDASERGLHLLAARLASQPETRVVLVVDQAEELFTLTADEEERRQFIDLLTTAVCEPRGPLLVTLTLRADFYDRPMRYPTLGRLVTTQSVAALPLAPAELRAAIEGPAALPDVGLRFEGALVGDLLDEVREQAGALPLLQFTLEQLYERRAGDLLTEAVYHALGGVRGALARHAEETYLGLPDEAQRRLARALFLRLIEPGASTQETTRRRAAVAELELADPTQTIRMRAVAEAFIAARLVTAQESGGVTTLEVSHEALIREWARLGAWLHEARADVRVQVRLSADAAEWQRRGRPLDSLYRGVMLAEARGWAARNTPSAREQAFLDAAVVEGQRQEAAEQARQARELALARRAAVRLRTLVAVLAVFLLVAAGLTTVALSIANQEQVARNQATAERNLALSRQLAAQAVTRMGGQYDLALLLSLEARRIAPTVEARDSLLRGLEAAPSGLIAFLHGQTLPVTSVVMSPNGKILASGSDDGTIRLWDVTDHHPLGAPLSGHAGTIKAMAFSPDGRILASTWSARNDILLWDVAHRRPLAPLTWSQSFQAVMESVTFSPDGKLLAAGTDHNTVRLWDVARRRPTPVAPFGLAASEQMTGVAFSPNGKILAAGSTDGTITLWNVATGSLVTPHRGLTGILNGHNGGVEAIAMNPDGKVLVAANQDHSIRLWDLVRQAPLGPPLRGHSAVVSSVAFSHQGTMVASGSLDGTVRLWDVRSRRPLGAPLVGYTGEVDGIVFSPDGATLASATTDGTIVLWNVRHRPSTGGIVYRQSTAVGDVQGEGVRGVMSVAFSPEGTTLAAGAADGHVQLWDRRTGLREQSVVTNLSPLQDVAFSPDGAVLAIVGSYTSSGLELWDVRARRSLPTPYSPQAGLVSVAFSPDGRLLATGSWDDTIQLWALARHRDTAQRLGPELTAHTGAVTGVAFSPDGRTLASVSVDGTVRLWDIRSRRPRGPPLIGTFGEVDAVAFNPTGRLLVTAGSDTAVRLWDIVRHRLQVSPLVGHTGAVDAVAFSPDGSMLASGGSDETVRLWDVASGQPLGVPLTGPTDNVSSLTFSPDGQSLAAGSYDGTIHLWDVNLRTWSRGACQIANRNLTRQEWRQYLGNRPYQKTCSTLPPGS